MKATIIAALLLAVALAQASAQPTPGRNLTMSGQDEIRAAPDLVTLSAGVTSEAATAAAALAANTARMQSVFAALKRLGVADTDMQTANFSVSPQMTEGNSQAQHIAGYRVGNQVEVRLQDVAKLGQALDALVTAGANQVNGVTFAIRNPAPLLAEARSQAVADARAKAETYARAAGVTLGPIQSIGENGDYAGPPRPMMMIAAKAVPIAAGEESVTAAVTIVWEIH